MQNLFMQIACRYLNILFLWLQTIDPLHKWRPSLNDNTLYIFSLVLMFPDKGFFTLMWGLGCISIVFQLSPPFIQRVYKFSAGEMQLWLQFRSRMNLLMYDQKIRNWKYIWVYLFRMFSFPCIQKISFTTIFDCINGKYIKKAKHQKMNLYLIVNILGFSAIMWRPFFQRKHVGEVLGNVLWGSPKNDEHVISPHNSN